MPYVETLPQEGSHLESLKGRFQHDATTDNRVTRDPAHPGLKGNQKENNQMCGSPILRHAQIRDPPFDLGPPAGQHEGRTRPLLTAEFAKPVDWPVERASQHVQPAAATTVHQQVLDPILNQTREAEPS